MTGSEIASAAAKQLLHWIFVAFVITLGVGVLVVLYMCDHYRWGGCS